MGQILYAEDDPLIRYELSEWLEAAGFQVLLADSGTTACSLLHTQGASILGLVTDIDLGPGLNGWDVARLGRELIPSLPVVYVSAHSHAEWAAEGVPSSTLIAKPFAATQVVVALSMALNAATGTPPLSDQAS